MILTFLEPLPATLDRNWKKAEREHMELSFQTQLRDHKLGQPIVIPEGYKTHSWPYRYLFIHLFEYYNPLSDCCYCFLNYVYFVGLSSVFLV